MPFSSLNECRYMVYWPVMTPDELDGKLAAIAEEQQRRDALDALTADMVICGEQQPESDHFVKMDRSETGYDGDLHWRRAWRDGWFSYSFNPKGKKADKIVVNYGPDKMRHADIFLDGTKIGSFGGDGTSPVEFPVNIAGNSQHIIKVVASDNSDSPNVYEIRLMKNQ